MSLRCLFGHRWAVTTWTTNVMVMVTPAEDHYDAKQDGREERWVALAYCLDCGVLRTLETRT